MTRFRFIHTADLHLGSPLTGLALKDRQIAQRFAAAGRDAFTALVDLALAESVDFVVIAGDLYDGPWKDNHIGLFFNREVARLSRAEIPVYFLRGNHDADSVVTRTIAMPEGVHEFSTRKPVTFEIDELRVALHGQGFANRAMNENLALDYPPARPGWFNIGVLHTSLSGRPPHAVYAPCTPADLASRGYDYWALGHVHEFEVVNAADPLVIYPGNLQGRNIRETGSKGAVLVTVDEGLISHERVIVDCARFERRAVVIAEDMREGDIKRTIEAAIEPLCEAADHGPLALRLELTGRSGSAGSIKAARQQWQDDIQAICQQLHADLWLEKLVVALEAPDKTVSALKGEASVDIAAIIDEIAVSPETLHDGQTLIAEIVGRLPGGAAADSEPLDESVEDLLQDARLLLLSKLEHQGEN